jgi:predicted nucleotidyltransferase
MFLRNVDICLAHTPLYVLEDSNVLKKADHVKIFVVCGRVIVLKLVLNKQSEGQGVDLFSPEQSPVSDCCGHDNEFLDSARSGDEILY